MKTENQKLFHSCVCYPTCAYVTIRVLSQQVPMSQKRLNCISMQKQNRGHSATYSESF